MKQYKLKKWYPGCGKQEVGSIVTKSNSGSPLYLGVKLTDTLYYTFPAKYVENNPEYWEEIVEKDYEILSILIQRSDNHQIRVVTHLDCQDYIKSLSKTQGNSIHSVKRLSDGEV